METQDNLFEDFDKELLPYRRDLLPWWIKLFSWLFIILGALAVVNGFTILFGVDFEVSLYGLESVLPQSVAALVSVLLMVLNGLAGYLLWFEHDRALVWGKITAFTGIVVAVFSTLASFPTGHIMFRFELIALIPFLIKLNSIRYEWEYESRKH